MTPSDNPSSLSNIASTITRYIKLLVEDTRLNAAEKLTRLLSAIALSAILLVVAIVAMLFVSLAIGFALADVLTPVWSFIIVAGFFVVIFAVLIFCRNILIVNPIARFISRLLLDAPTAPSKKNESAPVS